MGPLIINQWWGCTFISITDHLQYTAWSICGGICLISAPSSCSILYLSLDKYPDLRTSYEGKEKRICEHIYDRERVCTGWSGPHRWSNSLLNQDGHISLSDQPESIKQTHSRKECNSFTALSEKNAARNFGMHCKTYY